MAKKGPIGKVEGFYIEQNYRNMDIAVLAEDLDRTISSVENYIKKNITHKPKQVGVQAGDHFISYKGSTVMTENASTISDSKRKFSKPSSSCVTKIKKDI